MLVALVAVGLVDRLNDGVRVGEFAGQRVRPPHGVGVARGIPTGRSAQTVRFVERLEGVLAVVDRLTYRFDERLADAVPGTPLG